MRQTVLTILITLLTIFITGLIVVSFLYNFSLALYGAVMGIGNFIIPTIIAVIIFRQIKKKTTLQNNLLTKVLQTVVLSLIFVSALYIWAVIDVIIYYNGFSGLTVENINHDFGREFSRTLPITFFEAIIIPIIYGLLDRQKPSTT